MFFVTLLNGKLSTTEIIRCFKVTHSGIYHSFLSNAQWNSPCLPVFYCVWFCHVMEFVLSSINLKPFSHNIDQRQFSPNDIHTWSRR